MSSAERLEASGQIGIYDYRDWYLKNGGTPDQALEGWLRHERLAMEKGEIDATCAFWANAVASAVVPH